MAISYADKIYLQSKLRTFLHCIPTYVCNFFSEIDRNVISTFRYQTTLQEHFINTQINFPKNYLPEIRPDSG